MVSTSAPNEKKHSIDLASVCARVLDCAPIPTLTVDGASQTVKYVNPAFCRLVDQASDKLVGKSITGILPETKDYLALLEKVYLTGEPLNYIEEKSSLPTSRFWSYTMWPLGMMACPEGVVIQVAENGGIYNKTLAMNEALILGSVRQHELTEEADFWNKQLKEKISAQQQGEKELYKAKAQLMDRAGQLEEIVLDRTADLSAINHELESLVHTIAHDLRAPLRAMQGFSTMLLEEEGTTLSETGRNYAERINQSAHFMDSLLRDLLDFNCISQLHTELSPVKLGKAVEGVLCSLQKEILEKYAAVKTSDTWPVVLANEAILTRVLLNLIGNALKFVTPNHTPVVHVCAEIRGEVVRVWVKDNGIGIKPEHKEQIFKIFNRLNGDKYPGTGIGLAIVLKGVKLMGGRVGVESTFGVGSQFWFELQKAEV